MTINTEQFAAANKAGKYVGICGQGPSDHPDLAKWLVEEGIESLSLNPDTVVAQIEGGIVYGLSAALFGRISFAGGTLSSKLMYGSKRVKLVWSSCIAPSSVTEKRCSHGCSNG